MYVYLYIVVVSLVCHSEVAETCGMLVCGMFNLWLVCFSVRSPRLKDEALPVGAERVAQMV